VAGAYRRPEALIETAWLAAHLNDGKLRILDGSFTLPNVHPSGPELYARQHIPGAVFFDIEEIRDTTNPLPHMLPDEKAFAAAMRHLGIGSEHKIVVYDAFGLTSAPRVWWTLRVFSHKDVAVLNGGLPKWLAQWESDYWNLQSFICDFVETVMSRYLGRIRIWEVAARPNAGGALALTEENRLTLVAKILEVARQVDQEGQFLIRIDQPWGE